MNPGDRSGGADTQAVYISTILDEVRKLGYNPLDFTWHGVKPYLGIQPLLNRLYPDGYRCEGITSGPWYIILTFRKSVAGDPTDILFINDILRGELGP